MHKQQREEISHIEWMERQKQKVLYLEAEKSVLQEERDLRIKNLPHPYYKEIQACDSLVGFCNNLKVQFGLLKDSADVARQLEKEQHTAQVKERLNQRVD